MTEQFSNILIRGTNWIGDSIITIPALRELRRIFPKAKLTLMVKPWARDIFEGADYLDDILVYDKGSNKRLPGVAHIVKEIRKRRFEAAIFFQNAFEAAALSFLARIPTRIGYPTDGRRILLTHSLSLTKEILDAHQIYYYLYIVSQIEERFFGQSHVDFLHPQYKLEITKDQQDAARKVLDRFSIQQSKALIAINPGATNSRARRWLGDRFAALADRLIDRGDCTVAFVGAASENEIADKIIAQMRHKPVRLTGRTSLGESIGVLSLSDLLISNDTGPAYVSAALCRQTLTIYGSSNFWSICPTSPTSHIVHFPVHCSPCMLPDCPTQHECMVGVTVDMVYDKAMELLGKADHTKNKLPVLVSK
ncbi:MAG TPA: lipopolysaccharide heptosyltransferase II [Blastocatellia bacterium]|nr:lipopolysaccharide heptosyltransferase II [Blastocatellia bacterium]